MSVIESTKKTENRAFGVVKALEKKAQNRVKWVIKAHRKAPG